MTETVYSYFKKIADENPDKTAIIENGKSLTFKELSELIDRIAHTFPTGGKSVGLILSHGVYMVALIFAILKTGARYVPAEPDFPVGRINYMMSEAEVDFIVTEKKFSDKVKNFRLKFLEDMISAPDSDFSKAEATSPESPTDPAYVLYTSGTTGRPKGVCVTHSNVCHYVRAFANEFHPAPGDVMLQYSVCSFDIFVEEVFTSLLNGAALAIPDEADHANTDALMDFIKRHKVTIISGFPYLLSEMNHLPSLPPTLRLLISGGDVLREVYIDKLPQNIDIYNTYGPSETTVCATYYKCNGKNPLSDGTYPIGKAVKGATIEILDDNNEPALPGQTGEICISGDGVSLGYIGHHEKENLAFEKLPDGRTRYHSGDLGYTLPDGNIAFLHRKDTQIMIYGKRVEIAEVEAKLYRCKGVRQALVRAYKDESGLHYMVAYIVPSRKNIKVSAIKKELAKDLTPFMIPEFFVTIAEIPLNSNGKPDISLLPVVMKEGYGSEY